MVAIFEPQMLAENTCEFVSGVSMDLSVPNKQPEENFV